MRQSPKLRDLPDGDLDEVAIERVLKGEYAPLSRAEQVEVIRQMLIRRGAIDGRALRMNSETIRRIRAEIESTMKETA